MCVYIYIIYIYICVCIYINIYFIYYIYISSLPLVLLVLQVREAAASLIIQDNVIDGKTAEGLLKAFPATSDSVRGSSMHVPEELLNRFKHWLSKTDEAPTADGERAGAAVPPIVPVKQSTGSYGRHRDHYSVGRPVSGMVGVFYLSGDGQMVFTHDSTGQVSVYALHVTNSSYPFQLRYRLS
jgi:hypothetical protein